MVEKYNKYLFLINLYKSKYVKGFILSKSETINKITKDIGFGCDGSLNKYIKELREKGIFEFDNEEIRNGRYVNLYYINLKKLKEEIEKNNMFLETYNYIRRNSIVID